MKSLLIALLLVTTWSASLAHAEGPIESFINGWMEGFGKQVGEGRFDSPAQPERAQAQSGRPLSGSPPEPRELLIDTTGLPAEVIDGDRKYIFHGCERALSPSGQDPSHPNWVFLFGAPGGYVCGNIDMIPLGEENPPDPPSFKESFLICSLEVLNTTDEPVRHMVSGRRMEYVNGKGEDRTLCVAYDTRDYLAAGHRDVPAPPPDGANDGIYEFNLLPDKPLRLRGRSFEGKAADAAPSEVWGLSMQVRYDPRTGQRTILKYPKAVPVADRTGSR